MTALGFMIYYGDGTTFEGKPEDAPTENVQCIVIAPAHPTTEKAFYRHRILSEADMYVYSDPIGGWFACDKYEDLKRHLKQSGLGKGGIRAVLDGMWVNKKVYDEIILKAEREFGMTRR